MASYLINFVANTICIRNCSRMEMKPFLQSVNASMILFFFYVQVPRLMQGSFGVVVVMVVDSPGKQRPGKAPGGSCKLLH